MKFDQRVAIPNHVLFRETGDESVLLNLDNEYYYGLDDVGTHMWRVLTTSVSIQVAFETLLSDYDIDSEQLREQLTIFATELIEFGLLETNDV